MASQMATFKSWFSSRKAEGAVPERSSSKHSEIDFASSPSTKRVRPQSVSAATSSKGSSDSAPRQGSSRGSKHHSQQSKPQSSIDNDKRSSFYERIGKEEGAGSVNDNKGRCKTNPGQSIDKVVGESMEKGPSRGGGDLGRKSLHQQSDYFEARGQQARPKQPTLATEALSATRRQSQGWQERLAGRDEEEPQPLLESSARRNDPAASTPTSTPNARGTITQALRGTQGPPSTCQRDPPAVAAPPPPPKPVTPGDEQRRPAMQSASVAPATTAAAAAVAPIAFRSTSTAASNFDTDNDNDDDNLRAAAKCRTSQPPPLELPSYSPTASPPTPVAIAIHSPSPPKSPIDTQPPAASSADVAVDNDTTNFNESHSSSTRDQLTPASPLRLNGGGSDSDTGTTDDSVSRKPPHQPSQSHGDARRSDPLSNPPASEPASPGAASRSSSVPPVAARKVPAVSFNLPARHQRHASLSGHRHSSSLSSAPYRYWGAEQTYRTTTDGTLEPKMGNRKIWVKRPGASATLISISQDDLVDDVRDMILRKYANSIGRTFDAPDISIRVSPRDHHRERTLGPEEHIGRIVDAFFPGGQSIDEALTIDVPRRTPVTSPRPTNLYPATAIYLTEDGRPSEGGEGYFPPVAATSPRIPLTTSAHTNGTVPHSIAVLGTGHIPNIPSPGGTRSRPHRERQERPRLGRNHTSSPTFKPYGPPNSLSASAAANHGMNYFQPRHPHSRAHSNSSEHFKLSSIQRSKSPAPSEMTKVHIATPPARMSSPRPPNSRQKKGKKNTDSNPSLPLSMLDNSVPPINVLIVEDNPINLKLLEAFVKRLKVRWQTAMNGRDALKKWRDGGFHLVLMDIQLPVMNGLEATREIRRLEKLNSIGVFSSSPGSLPQEAPKEELADGDRLENLSLFKSPVIIVALTASSLRSDRHEALAAGCNDFLTKPVNYVWLERKVREWGCMQALIDFDGWRQWKDFSQQAEDLESSKKTAKSHKIKRGR